MSNALLISITLYDGNICGLSFSNIKIHLTHWSITTLMTVIGSIFNFFTFTVYVYLRIYIKKHGMENNTSSPNACAKEFIRTKNNRCSELNQGRPWLNNPPKIQLQHTVSILLLYDSTYIAFIRLILPSLLPHNPLDKKPHPTSFPALLLEKKPERKERKISDFFFERRSAGNEVATPP